VGSSPPPKPPSPLLGGFRKDGAGGRAETCACAGGDLYFLLLPPQTFPGASVVAPEVGLGAIVSAASSAFCCISSSNFFCVFFWFFDRFLSVLWLMGAADDGEEFGLSQTDASCFLGASKVKSASVIFSATVFR